MFLSGGQGQLHWPLGADGKELDEQLKDLIDKLMCPEPEERLGARGGADAGGARPWRREAPGGAGSGLIGRRRPARGFERRSRRRRHAREAAAAGQRVVTREESIFLPLLRPAPRSI